MRISRRFFSSALTAFAAEGWRPALAEANQFWGALRWDAWWGASRDALDAQRDLWPHRWQFRAPAWAKPEGRDKLVFTPSQDAMDDEIQAASRAGLKYWAYDYYPTNIDHDFMNGLAFHRKSNLRNQVKYCLIVQLGHWGGESEYSLVNDSIAAFTGDDFYLRVHGRPVVFLLWNQRLFATRFEARFAPVLIRLADLRRRVEAVGAFSPYVALMTPNDVRTIKEIGADALADYAIAPHMGKTPMSFSAYDRYVRTRWSALLKTGSQVVPTVMTGWDMRPIAEDPPPWYRDDVPENAESGFVRTASPEELAEHLRAGVAFVNDHPSQCREKLGLIYSWDECSEGGNVLAPTGGDPSAHLLAALAAVLR
jgi:hypothetical protein